MGFRTTLDYLEIDSVDLYIRVKLGGLNGKVLGGRRGNVVLFHVKSMKAGSGKSTVSVGIKSRRVDKKEGDITVISLGELAKIWGDSRGLKVMRLVAVTNQEIDIPYSDRESDRRGVSIEIGCSSEEDIAVEVQGTFKERRSETMGSGFKVGDLVWGRVKSHPWWPGHIYDEALASSQVMQRKTEGFLLVAFFGDDTYGWLQPKDLLPFERHYKKNSKQLKSKDFLTAVQDAVEEVNRRAELGFSCHCRNISDFPPENSVDQVGRSLEEFRPSELVNYLQKLALGPTNMLADCDYLKNVARILAYRKAIFEEKDYTYAEAFGVLPKSQGDTNAGSSDRNKTLCQGAESTEKETESRASKSQREVSSSSKSPTAETLSESKILGKRAKISKPVHTQKLSRNSSGDHVPENRSTPAVVKPAMAVSPRKTNVEVKVLDKISLISKPAKPLASIGPLEKAPRKGDLPLKNRAETKALASPKGVVEDVVEPKAVLVVKFPRGATLPSISELKARFAWFGPLDVPATYASWRSSTCHVGFKRSSDASAAYEHILGNGNMYRNTKVSCRLKDPEMLSPMSPKSAKLLGKDFKKVPRLWSPSSVEVASGSDGRGNYILSTEASSQEDDTKRIQKTIRPSALPPLVPAYPGILCPEALVQFVETMNRKHLERLQNGTSSSSNSHDQQTTATNKPDISIPMLNLLKSLAKSINSVKAK